MTDGAAPRAQPFRSAAWIVGVVLAVGSLVAHVALHVGEVLHSTSDEGLLIPIAQQWRDGSLFPSDQWLTVCARVYSHLYSAVLALALSLAQDPVVALRALSLPFLVVYFAGSFRVIARVATVRAASVATAALAVLPFLLASGWDGIATTLPLGAAAALPRDLVFAFIPWLWLALADGERKSVVAHVAIYGCLGVLVNLHPLTAVHVIGAFALVELSLRPTQQTLVRLSLCALAVVLCASPYILQYTQFPRTPGSASADVIRWRIENIGAETMSGWTRRMELAVWFAAAQWLVGRGRGVELARIVHQTPRLPEPGGRLSSREPRRGLRTRCFGSRLETRSAGSRGGQSVQVGESIQSACDIGGNTRSPRIPAKPGDRCGLGDAADTAQRWLARLTLVALALAAIAPIAQLVVPGIQLGRLTRVVTWSASVGVLMGLPSASRSRRVPRLALATVCVACALLGQTAVLATAGARRGVLEYVARRVEVRVSSDAAPPASPVPIRVTAGDPSLDVERGRQFREVCDFARTTSEVGDRFLVPPEDFGAFRAYARRAIVASRKEGSTMLAFLGGRGADWFDDYLRIANTYATGDTSAWDALAARYGTRWAILDGDLPVPASWTEHFRAGPYRVLRTSVE